MLGNIISIPIIPPKKKSFDFNKFLCGVNNIPIRKEIIKNVMEYLFKKAIPQTIKIKYQIFVFEVCISFTMR